MQFMSKENIEYWKSSYRIGNILIYNIGSYQKSQEIQIEIQ